MTIDPSTTLPPMEGCARGVFWTYGLVEERLVEAMRVARAMPDRERGWLTVRAFWPDIVRERCLGDYDSYGYLGNSSDLPPVRIPLTRAEIARMQEAEGWLGRYLDEPARVLVVLATGWRVGGRRIGWTRIGRILGLTLGREALKRRYMTAIATIACGLNGKGAASMRQMVREWLLSESHHAVGDAGAAPGRAAGARRRRIEVDIVYTE